MKTTRLRRPGTEWHAVTAETSHGLALACGRVFHVAECLPPREGAIGCQDCREALARAFVDTMPEPENEPPTSGPVAMMWAVA